MRCVAPFQGNGLSPVKSRIVKGEIGIERSIAVSIVKSFSVGDGDMFYIYHNSDNFTTIDCCYSDDDNKKVCFDEIKALAGEKGIKRFISTHPDEDHIKGIEDFCKQIGILNFYCVENEAIKTDETDSFKKYCELRDSDKAYYVYKGCTRRWMNISDDERGCAGINFLWPIISNDDFENALERVKEGVGYNNISPIFTYSIERGVEIMWMGDIEKDFLEKVKDDIDWPEIDILFAPHHGRESGKVPTDILKKLNPQIIVIGEAPSKHLNYYAGYNTITQNSANDIVFWCTDGFVHVYVGNSTYSVDFLEDQSKECSKYGSYIGSFKTKANIE